MKVLLKDFECKWHNVEFKVDKKNRFVCFPRIRTLEQAKQEYGDYYVYSYKYFEDTKSTSIIVGKTPKWDCEEDTTPHFTKEQVESFFSKVKVK